MPKHQTSETVHKRDIMCMASKHNKTPHKTNMTSQIGKSMVFNMKDYMSKASRQEWHSTNTPRCGGLLAQP
eukprot:7019109-Karenia_brevis.AAC.1